MPPLETLLGAAAALLLLLVSHLYVLFVRRRRGRLTQQENAPAAPASSTADSASLPSGSSTGIEGLVTEDDLRQLVSSLGVAAREPELEGWEHVIAKGNDTVSYKAWCDKTTDGPPKYLSVTTYVGCSTELLRDFYMDNEYRMEWDNTVIKHEQLQCDENSGIEIGRTVKKFPLLTPREYILAWRIWASDENSFYCFVKECEHSLAPRQRKFVRVRLLRSGWCIRKVPGRDACQITVLHHEDNGMNIKMAKLAFSKGIWNYICKTNNALRRYPQHHGPSISILTMQRLIKKFPRALQTNMDESHRSRVNAVAAVVPCTHSSGTSPCKQRGKKLSRETIASGLLLIGSIVSLSKGRSNLGAQLAMACIVCLSKDRSNLGAQLAMAFFLKKAFKQDKESGSPPRGRTDATVSMH